MQNSKLGGRCRFQIIDNGKKAIWQITNICNYSCSYCIFASGPNRIHGELTTQEAVRVVNELCKSGFYYLKITGGEPTTRRDLPTIISAVGDAGISFDLSTNASQISPELLTALKRTRPQFVHISLDGGTAEVQSKMRGPNTFSKTTNGIRLLASEDIRIRIGTVIGLNNQGELERIVTLACELGADEIVFSRLIPAGRIKGDTSHSSTLSDLELSDIIESLRCQFGREIVIQDHFSNECSYRSERCPGGDRFIYIDNFGRISPCTWASDNGLATLTRASLREQPLPTLLSSPEINQYRKYIRDFKFNGCPLSEAPL